MYPDWEQRYTQHIRTLRPSQSAIVSNLVDAVRTGDRKPRRVLATAGSGKTHTVVGATTYMINERVLSAEDILCTTFTRVAADEMAERLRPLLPTGIIATKEEKAQARSQRRRISTRLRLGTFHGLAYRYLLRDRTMAQPPHEWSQSRLMNLSLRARNQRPVRDPRSAEHVTTSGLWEKILGNWKIPGLRDARGLRNVDKWGERFTRKLRDISPKDVALAIGVVRGQGFNRHELDDARAALEEHAGYNAEIFWQAWRLYDTAKDALGGFDFADCLYWYWKKGRDSAKVVIVDEAQDNSPVQLSLATDIARRGSGYIVLVGDVRQSIYGWRGAQPEIMGEADRTMGAITLEIRENHRSGSSIVGLGNAICINPQDGTPEPWAVGGEAVATRTAPGGEPFRGEIRLLPGTEGARHATIAEEIREAVEGGRLILDKRSGHPRPVEWADFMILCRTNGMMAPFEAAFTRRQIPYRIVGSSGFFDSKVARRVMALLALAFDSQLPARDGPSSWPAFKRIWNMIKYGDPPGFKFMGAPHAETHWVEKWEGNSFATLRALARSRAWATFKRRGPRGYESFKPDWKADTDELLLVLDDIRESPETVGDVPASRRTGQGSLRPTTAAERFEFAVEKALRYLQGFASESKEGEESNDPDAALLDMFAVVAQGHDSYASLYDFAEQARADQADKRRRTDLSAAELARLEELARNKVTVSTIHRAKGAEAGCVYVLIGEGELPHKMSGPESPGEQRLFYVAATRARDELVLAWEGGESVFVTERVRPFLRGREEDQPTSADDPPEEEEPEEPARIEVVEPDAPLPEPPEPLLELDPEQAAILVVEGEESTAAPSGSLEDAFLEFRRYLEEVDLDWFGGLPMSREEFLSFLDGHRSQVVQLIAEIQGRQAASGDREPEELEPEELEPEELEPTRGEADRDLDGQTSGRRAVQVTIPKPSRARTSSARIYLGPGVQPSSWAHLPRGASITLLSDALLILEDSGPDGLGSDAGPKKKGKKQAVSDMHVRYYRVSESGEAGLRLVFEVQGAVVRDDPKPYEDFWSSERQRVARLYEASPAKGIRGLLALREITAGQPFHVCARGQMVASLTQEGSTVVLEGRALALEGGEEHGLLVPVEGAKDTYRWCLETPAE